MIRTRTSGIIVDVKPAFIPASFTPLNLPNLLAWYDASHTPQTVFSDAGITPATNGQAVKQWNDSSGNGYHLTKTSLNNEPTYKTSILNGLPVVDNNNVASELGITTNGAPVSLGGTVCSVFAVVKFTTVAGSARIASVGTVANQDTGTDGFTLYASNLTTVKTFRVADESNGTITSGTWNELGTIFDGTNNIEYINTVAQNTVAEANTFGTSVDLSLLTDRSLVNAITGQMAEAVFTKSAMSVADRANLHTYFINKWGV